MKGEKEMSAVKRIFLVGVAVLTMLALLIGCATPTPEVREVEKVVTQVVKETVIVEGTPQVVEKEVTKIVTEKEIVKETVEVVVPPARQGGTLVASLQVNVRDTLNQHWSIHTGSRMVAHHVLDTLVAVNPEDNEVYPWLATSWEVSPDGKVYTFKLRDDVTFHDGTPFNAEAVKYNFEYTMRPDIKHGFAYPSMGAEALEKIEVLDEYTVRFTFSASQPTFLISLSDGGLGIDSPAAMEEAGDEDYGLKVLVGTGPFKFVEWEVNDHVTMVRNDEYNWAPSFLKHNGPPYLDEIIWRDVAEEATRAAALEAGEIHVARLSEPMVAQFEGNEDVDMLLIPKAGTTRMYLINTAWPPTDDIRVRQAINHAIDKEGLLQLPAWGGLGEPGVGPLPAVLHPGGDDSMLQQYDYAFDLEKAKQLLDEAGWVDEDGNGIREKDGQELVLRFLTTSAEVPKVEPVDDMLRDVGMALNIETGDFNWFIAERSQRQFNMALSSDSGYDPVRLLRYFFHSESPSDNYGYSNADELLDKARSAANLDEMWEYLFQAEAQIMQDAVGVMGWQLIYVYGARANVRDVGFNEVAFPYFYDTWIED
jgi:peptide/nickel transport system substrate-binding protein